MSADSFRRTLTRLCSLRALVLLALAASLAATFAGLALAAGEGPGRSSGLSPADERRLDERQDKEKAERERRRRDPKERAERDRSRLAHTDEKVGAAEAADLVAESFGPGVLDSPGDEPLTRPGERVERFLSDTAAVLESDRGQRRIVESSGFPLRDPGGDPIDLELREDGDGFSPTETAAKMRLPKDVGEGISFPGTGVRLRPVESEDSGSKEKKGDAPARPEGRKRGEGVAWPKVWRDTDLLAVPNPTGGQVLAQLRSASSPQELTLEAELPDGAKLKEANDGARVLDGEGKTLAELSPPITRDADGEEIPTEMRVEDEKRVVLRVEHRGGDWRYPLLLDPVYTDYSWYSGTDRSNPLEGWAAFRNDEHFTFTTGTADNTCYRGPEPTQAVTNPDCRGLYIFTTPDTNFNVGMYGYWYWNAPGQTTYLDRVDFQSMALSQRGEGTPKPDLYAGIMSANRATWTGYLNHPFTYGPATESVVPGQNTSGVDPKIGHTAAAWLYFDSNGHRAARAHTYLGGARMYMNDPEPPAMGALSHDGEAFPTGWTNKTFPRVSVAASDPGLGVKQIFLRGPVGLERERKVQAPAGGECQGSRQVPCPATTAAAFDYQSTEQQEGIHTFETRALDALGKQSPVRSHQLKIDRTAPVVQSSGSLKDAGGTTLRSDGTLALHSEAKDESLLGPRAGVGSLEVALNNVAVTPTPTCNTDSCPITRDYSLNTATIPEGDHEVRVTATDRAGNKTVETHRFSIDRPGEYRVSVCDDAPGNKNNSFTYSGGGDWSGAQNCPSNGSVSGGLYAAARSPGSEPRGNWAGWTFAAPTNTTLRSIDFDLHSRSGGNRGDQVDPILVTDLSQILSFFRGDNWGRVQGKAVTLNAGTRRVRAQVGCGAGDRCYFNQDYGNIALHGATITVADPQLPTVALTGGSIATRTWQRGEADLIASLTDNVGVRAGRLLLDGAERERRSFECDYTRPAPCQSRPGERFMLDTTALPDGSTHTARVATEDGSGHEAGAERSFRVDNTKPLLLASGALKDADRKRLVDGRDYGLHVDARDGALGLPQSGVEAIDILIDGERVDGAAQTCPRTSDSCSLSDDYTLRPDSLTEGAHEVKVLVRDRAGNETSETYTVNVGSPGTGERPTYTFEDFELDSGTTLKVNVANGNMLVKADDIEVEADFGFPVDIDRFYNSQADDLLSSMGRGWSTGIGSDVRAQGGDGAVTLMAPSGDPVRFARNPDGSYRAPPGVDAELRRQGEGFVATYLEQNDKVDFTGPGQAMRAITDEDGNEMSVRYRDDGAIDRIRDTRGRETVFTTNSDRQVTAIEDPDGRRVEYSPGPDGRLDSVTRDGETTRFRYNLRGYLSEIIEPDGERTLIDYHEDKEPCLTEVLRPLPAPIGGEGLAHTCKVKSVTRSADALGNGSKTTFAYAPSPSRRTTVTDPEGRADVYTYNATLFVTESTHGSGAPSLSLSGTLAAQNGQALADGGSYRLQANASDSSGVRKVDVDIDGDRPDRTDDSCGDGCANPSWDVLTSEYRDRGEYVVEVVATDNDGDVGKKRIKFLTPAGNQATTEDPPQTTTEERQQAREFRTTFGLDASDAQLDRVLGDPSLRQGFQPYGTPLLPEEEQYLENGQLLVRASGALDDYGRQSAPDTYAGQYTDFRNGGAVVVGFTRDAESHLPALRGAFPYPDRLRVVTVERSKATLDALAARVWDERRDLKLQGVDIQTVSVSTEGNVAEIMVPTPDAAQAAVVAGRYGPGVRLVEGSPMQQARTDRIRPLIAGTRIWRSGGGGCSLNVPARRGGSNYMLTAGHCGDIGTGWSQGGGGYADSNRIGTMRFNKYQTRRYKSDAGAIKLSRRLTARRSIYRSSRSRLAVSEVGNIGGPEDKPGVVTCFSGATTNKNVCGKLTVVAAPIDSNCEAKTAVGCKDGVDEYQLWFIDRGSQLGDSGGAYYQPIQKGKTVRVVGVLRGGTRSLSAYSHIRNAEEDLGVQVVTGRKR